MRPARTCQVALGCWQDAEEQGDSAPKGELTQGLLARKGDQRQHRLLPEAAQWPRLAYTEGSPLQHLSVCTDDRGARWRVNVEQIRDTRQPEHHSRSLLSFCPAVVTASISRV